MAFVVSYFIDKKVLFKMYNSYLIDRSFINRYVLLFLIIDHEKN